MLKNAPTLAIGGVDAEENEHCKVCPLSVYRSPKYQDSETFLRQVGLKWGTSQGASSVSPFPLKGKAKRALSFVDYARRREQITRELARAAADLESDACWRLFRCRSACEFSARLRGPRWVHVISCAISHDRTIPRAASSAEEFNGRT